MGLALTIIGLLMVIVGGRGTYAQFGKQLSYDFTGGGNFKQSFTIWFLAIAGIGAIGYLPALQTISRMLLALVLIVIFLANKGFFQQFTQALQTGPQQPAALPTGSGQTTPLASAAGTLQGAQTVLVNPTYAAAVPPAINSEVGMAQFAGAPTYLAGF